MGLNLMDLVLNFSWLVYLGCGSPANDRFTKPVSKDQSSSE
jgi:hypothetical protein